jgi:hypothetical protein
MKHFLFTILMSPDTFFKKAITEKESLKIPALVVLASAFVATAAGFIIGGPAARMMSGIMPGMESIIMLSAVIITPVIVFGVWLIWAGIMYALSTLFKGKGTFKKTLEFVGYGFVPQVLGTIITLIAALEYIPRVKVPQIAAASLQDPQVIQDALKSLMHDPAMTEFTQITTLISIVFLLWCANIWIFGIKHARMLSMRDAAICVAVPVVGYIFYMIYNLGAL